MTTQTAGTSGTRAERLIEEAEARIADADRVACALLPHLEEFVQIGLRSPIEIRRLSYKRCRGHAPRGAECATCEGYCHEFLALNSRVLDMCNIEGDWPRAFVALYDGEGPRHVCLNANLVPAEQARAFARAMALYCSSSDISRQPEPAEAYKFADNILKRHAEINGLEWSEQIADKQAILRLS